VTDTPDQPTRVVVDLGDRSYPIDIGSGVIQDTDRLRSTVTSQQVLIVSNELVAAHHSAPLLSAFSDRQTHLTLLPEGEQHKNLAAVDRIVDDLISNAFDRQCTHWLRRGELPARRHVRAGAHHAAGASGLLGRW